MIEIYICLFILQLEVFASNLTGHILEGDYTDIKNYPHSLYLHITCKLPYICGGSILNQDTALTAAHCLEDCGTGALIYLKYGHANIKDMRIRVVKSYLIHEKYDPVTMCNDIALVAARLPLQLASFSKRIAIMRNPPNVEWGYVAGWGIVNDQADVAESLKYTKQKLQSPKTCRIIGKLPVGSFCAGPIGAGHGIGSPDQGDSGSALVVNKYVQIGIVSYKTEKSNLMVYVNVSYYYNWIKRAASKLFCRNNYVRKLK